MKKLFIEVRARVKLKLPEKELAKMPQKIGLVTTVQFAHLLPEVQQMLERLGKKVILPKGVHSKYKGQVLGCDLPHSCACDAFLFLGDGRFHAEGVALRTGKPVFACSPNGGKCIQITAAEIDAMKKKQRGAYLAFLSSKNIGIIISTKPGQNHLREAIAFSKKHADKGFYFLVCDTLPVEQLENFPFIDFYINSACPRLLEDIRNLGKKAANLDELSQHLAG